MASLSRYVTAPYIVQSRHDARETVLLPEIPPPPSGPPWRCKTPGNTTFMYIHRLSLIVIHSIYFFFKSNDQVTFLSNRILKGLNDPYLCMCVCVFVYIRLCIVSVRTRAGECIKFDESEMKQSRLKFTPTPLTCRFKICRGRLVCFMQAGPTAQTQQLFRLPEVGSVTSLSSR